MRQAFCSTPQSNPRPNLHASPQALVESRAEALDTGAVNAAVSEAAELVSDSDLTVTAQTLQLATAVLRHQPAAGATVAQKARLATAGPELLPMRDAVKLE